MPGENQLTFPTGAAWHCLQHGQHRRVFPGPTRRHGVHAGCVCTAVPVPRGRVVSLEGSRAQARVRAGVGRTWARASEERITAWGSWRAACAGVCGLQASTHA